MQGIRLDQNALKIQLAKELPQHRPFVILPGGVAGLPDGPTLADRAGAGPAGRISG
jgi:hypothetical protein